MEFDFIKRLNNDYPNIWLAFDSDLNRNIIVKFFSTGDEAFNIESAKVLARINHINVVKVHAVTGLEHPETREYTDCMIMDYVRGKTLMDTLEETINIDTLSQLAAQLMDALEATHAKNLLHGDLHSENILVSQNGNIKLIDMFPLGSFSRVNEKNKNNRLQSDLLALQRVLLEMLRGSTIREKTAQFSEILNIKDNLSLAQIRKIFTNKLHLIKNSKTGNVFSNWASKYYNKNSSCVKTETNSSFNYLIKNGSSEKIGLVIQEGIFFYSHLTSALRETIYLKNKLIDSSELTKVTLMIICSNRFTAKQVVSDLNYMIIIKMLNENISDFNLIIARYSTEKNGVELNIIHDTARDQYDHEDDLKRFRDKLDLKYYLEEDDFYD